MDTEVALRSSVNGSVMLERQDWLATVTLSHAAKLNAMSRSMWRELQQTFEALNQDKSLRCIVIQGVAGHFCAGGDISEYPEFRFTEVGLRNFHENEVWGALRAMLDCDIPIAAQIEGNCMGAGIEISCCCDIRVAAISATFGAPIAKLGFPMAPHEAALVKREMGGRLVREMLLEARLYSAEEMLHAGFLNRIVPDGECANTVAASARKIAELSPQAARLNKQTLRTLNYVEHSDLFLTQAYAYADSAEHREGIQAFVDKRKTKF